MISRRATTRTSQGRPRGRSRPRSTGTPRAASPGPSGPRRSRRSLGPGRGAAGEEVADLLEQHLAAPGRSSRRFLTYVQPGQRLDQPEDRKADDQELNDGVQENAEIQRHRARLLRVGESRLRRPLQRHKDVGEVDAADQQTDKRCEDVLDQAVNDGSEGDPDDNADGQIDHIAAHYESFEFIDPAGPVDTESYCTSFAPDASPPPALRLLPSVFTYDECHWPMDLRH